MSRGGDLLGAALVGGGLALLGVAIGSALRDERPPPPAPSFNAMATALRVTADFMSSFSLLLTCL